MAEAGPVIFSWPRYIATASRASHVSIDDGLLLTDAFIAAAVRCAPPDNKPTPEEILTCQSHLEAELAQLKHIHVVVTLGKIAFDVWWMVMARQGVAIKPRPKFGHGAVIRPKAGPIVIASYHPSRQNTHTGKLTPPMMSSVFRKAAQIVGRQTLRTVPYRLQATGYWLPLSWAYTLCAFTEKKRQRPPCRFRHVGCGESSA